MGINDTKVPEFKAGDRIGDCEVLEFAGQGGMAAVYKVRKDALEVVRAVKVMDEKRDADRFLTEARTSANLVHPNVVATYAVGKTADNRPYIEMEYVDGADLGSLIQKHGKIPWKTAVAITAYIARALEMAHTTKCVLYGETRKGMIHRDVKPQNIMIGRNGTVKLVDFGVAKPVGLAMHTKGSAMLGSPHYLSPEQLDAKQVDFRTDIYSLGCVFYEMLMGEMTFGSTSIFEVVRAKQEGGYKKLPTDNCPLSVGKCVEKCLAVDALERYQSASDLLKDLEEFLNDMSEAQRAERVKNVFEGNISNDTMMRKYPVGPGNSGLIQLLKVVLILVVLAVMAVFALHFGPVLLQKGTGLVAAKPHEIGTPVEQGWSSQPAPVMERIDSANMSVNEPVEPAVESQKERGLKLSQSTSAAKMSLWKKKKLVSVPRSQAKPVRIQPRVKPVNEKERKADTAESKTPAEISPNDGYFFFLQGKSAFERGDYEFAVAAIDNAFLTPTAGDRESLLREGVYLKAIAVERLFISGKLNRTNVAAAWVSVQRMYKEGEARRIEADAKVKDYKE